MIHRRVCASLVLALALIAAPALAQQQEHEQHHPAGPPPLAAAAPDTGMPGGAMAGAGGMPMMGMMRMIMGQDGMSGMSMMAGHVEGRLAFLKTELKITDDSSRSGTRSPTRSAPMPKGWAQCPTG
jgi:hypothetical protein